MKCKSFWRIQFHVESGRNVGVLLILAALLRGYNNSLLVDLSWENGPFKYWFRISIFNFTFLIQKQVEVVLWYWASQTMLLRYFLMLRFGGHGLVIVFENFKNLCQIWIRLTHLFCIFCTYLVINIFPYLAISLKFLVYLVSYVFTMIH